MSRALRAFPLPLPLPVSRMHVVRGITLMLVEISLTWSQQLCYPVLLMARFLPAGRYEDVFVQGHSLMGVAAVRYALEQAAGLILLGSTMLPAVSDLYPTARTWWAFQPAGVKYK